MHEGVLQCFTIEVGVVAGARFLYVVHFGAVRDALRHIIHGRVVDDRRVVIFQGCSARHGRGLSLGLSAQCEGFIAFVYAIVGGLDGDAEVGVARWDSDREGAIAFDGHGLCGAILVGDGHFGTGEVCACRRAVAC